MSYSQQERMDPTALQCHSALGKRHRFSNTDYKIAFLVPLSVELAPIRAMLDTIHDDLPVNRDQNAYTLGSLGQHNVVIAVLPSIGNNDSGVVANQLTNDFPSIRFGLLVGVGGGVPGQHDIRLGDVVVSEPTGTTGGVLQFDRGKRCAGEGLRVTGHLNKPSPMLNATVKKLKAQHMQQGNRIRSLILDMIRKNPGMKGKFNRPGLETDDLYESSYKHIGGDTCQGCDKNKRLVRPVRENNEVEIHYGTIGSSNMIIKDADERDRLSRDYNLLSVEMEAAGIMDTLPCLVIRGICDYADSHKKKMWQPYAAAAAAAYAKELLQVVPPDASAAVESTSLDYTPVESSSFRSTEERDQQYDRLLKSLVFNRMDARLRNIAEAHPQTCKWLFGHKHIKSWFERQQIEQHHGFFWIKGKPGSGKSTIMKATLKRAKREWKKEIILSYFFNARAPTELEKSGIGLYRSLVHQLLCECPQLQFLFLKQFQSKGVGGDVSDWTAPELQEFLANSIQYIQDRAVNIFIDALDEGGERDVRQMITFLEDFALSAALCNFPLRICLSSRHFPHISIKRGFSLILENQDGHDADLKTFICSKLVHDGSVEMSLLHDEVFRKSKQIFLWVVLVIPILNKEHDKGKSVRYMHQRLEEIPEELDDLFTRIIAQSDEDIKECLLLLQWVLFSRRPLSPAELDLALKTSSTSSHHGEASSPERTARYLLNTSRGLTEITADPPTVQFIHETVREFLKQKGLAQIDPKLAGNIEGHSHERLKSGCLQYLKQHALSIRTTTKLQKPHQLEFKKRLPLVEYVAAHLFNHANLAQTYGVWQQSFLERLRGSDLPTFQAWVRARNAFQPYIIRQYSTEVPLLYALVEQEQVSLVELLINNAADVNEKGERFGTALQAACATGSEQTVKLLLSAGANVNAEGGEFGHALITAIHYKRESVVELLAQNNAKPVSSLLQAWLNKTCARNYLFGVTTLLNLGANPNVQKISGESLLSSEARRGHTAIVQALIEAGANVNFESREPYGYALHEACVKGFEPIIRLLIGAGANVNARGGYQGNILQQACYYGPEQVVRLLLEGGADVNAQGGPFGNALQVACIFGSEQTIRILLDAGADVNAQGGHYDTALRAASVRGTEQVVRLLLDAGADINARVGYSFNALETARFFCRTTIESVLLEAGAH